MKSRSKRLCVQVVLVVSLITFFLSSGQAAEVTLSVSESTGLPGSTDNPVQISLDNQGDRSTGIQFDICRGDFLSLSGCDSTDRSSGITCNSFDQGNGCDRIIFFGIGGDFIDTGTGPLIELRYDTSLSAVDGTCQDLTLENVTMPSCIDDGSGGCTTGPPLTEVVLQSGQFCFGDSIPSTTTALSTTTAPVTTTALPVTTTTPTTAPTTTPTTAPTTTPTTAPTTTPTTAPTTTPTTAPTTTPATTTAPKTTTTILPSYEVSISPSETTLDSGATLQFNAGTTDDEEEVAGAYVWEIVPESAIGSEIDDEGVFTSGDNTTASDVQETIRVTDADHGNESATARVTVKVKVEPPPECVVVINPPAATVFSGSTLTLEAETTGDGCATGEYEWLIESTIGSTIDQEGNYSAGIQNKGSQVTDVITVVDYANADITASATMAIEGKTVTVFPDRLLGSRWIPLPYLLMITGEDTVFSPASTVEFEPKGDIIALGQAGLGDIFFTLFFLNANPQEGTVSIMINTGEEIVTGEITIELIPFPFAE